MEFINKDVPEGVLTISDPNNPPKLNKLKGKRYLILSPTVNAGLEPECKMSDFEKEKEIGKGGFGQVYKVIHKKTNKIYCIKVIQKQGIIEQKLAKQMNREIEIMYILNHPHCLRLKNHFEDDQNFYLVMPLAEKGQLYKILKRFKKFDERTTAQILRETISSLIYLHSFNPPIIHRDIKPENLLLNKEGRILLADFGWSNYNDGQVRKTFCGTPEYIAPEMLLKKGHDQRVDIWSIGILMFELLSGYSPFKANTNADLYTNIRKLRIHWPKEMTPLARNLIGKILKLNPSDRPSLKEILEHQWFKSTKIIKPLLENNLKTTKDLLAFHMLSEATDDLLNRINKILNLTGEAADNENAKKANQNTAGSETKVKNHLIDSIKKDDELNRYNSVNFGGTLGINVVKEETDKLLRDMAEVKKTSEDLKLKNLTLNTEVTKLRTENKKLREENTDALKETIANKDKEIAELKQKTQQRLNLLSDIEQKEIKIVELNGQITNLKAEEENKDKIIKELQEKNKKLQQQCDAKDEQMFEMQKSYNKLEQDRQMDSLEAQRKIEQLQLKIVESATEDVSSPGGVIKVLEILNNNIEEARRLFKNKFDKYNESIEIFTQEYKKRENSITDLLNEKTKVMHENLNVFHKNIIAARQKLLDKSDKGSNNLKDQKIDWLNKQVTDLTEYKRKGQELERKLADTTSNLENIDKQYKTVQETLKIKEKEVKCTMEKNAVLQKDIDNLKRELTDMNEFLSRNCPPTLLEKLRSEKKK